MPKITSIHDLIGKYCHDSEDYKRVDSLLIVDETTYFVLVHQDNDGNDSDTIEIREAAELLGMATFHETMPPIESDIEVAA